MIDSLQTQLLQVHPRGEHPTAALPDHHGTSSKGDVVLVGAVSARGTALPVSYHRWLSVGQPEAPHPRVRLPPLLRSPWTVL